MKLISVLALALGVVSARSTGYHYDAPKTSYGLPSYQYGSGASEFSSAYANSGSGSIYKEYPSLGHSYTGSINSASEFGSGLSSTDYNGDYYNDYSGSYSSDLSSGFGSGLGSSYYLNSDSSSLGHTVKPVYQFTGSSSNGGYQSQYQSSQYQASALEKYKNYYQISQQPTQVFKHFYVHAAPEEPEAEKPRTPIVLPPAQKHYKIIFVKAPSQSRAPQVISVPQVQNEEKTIVYVLVKKPEESQDVIVPKVEQKPPSKPEVFFIKYKNKEDSQTLIDNIVKDYNKGQPASLINTGVEEGLSSSSGQSIGSGFGSNYGSSVLGDTYDNSGLSSSYDNSGLSSLGINSGLSSYDTDLSTSYGNSGLSSSYGDSGFTNYDNNGFGSSTFQGPVHSEASASSFGSHAFGISASPATQTLSLSSADSASSQGQVATSVSSSPVTVSSTASTISYDDANAIPTSQGVPHETYGPPKFRVD